MTQPDSETPCVFVIFNPVSGTEDPEKRIAEITETFDRHGYTCQILATTVKKGAREMAGEALALAPALVAVSGGDGTVVQVMSALVGSDVPIAILPAGTGNLLALNLGIPTSTTAAVEAALDGVPHKIDLGRVGRDRYFAVMGGVGFDADIIHSADRASKRLFGIAAYLGAAIVNIRRRNVLVEVVLDDRPSFTRRVKSLVIANMGKVTGGIVAFPTARPDDGWLDVGILKPDSFTQWLRVVVRALFRRPQHYRDIEIVQARRIQVKLPSPRRAELDGEDIGIVDRLDIEVVPQAVSVLVPRNARAESIGAARLDEARLETSAANS